MISTTVSQDVSNLDKEREEFSSKSGSDQNFPYDNTHDIVDNGAREIIPFLMDLELRDSYPYPISNKPSLNTIPNSPKYLSPPKLNTSLDQHTRYPHGK